MRLESKPAVNLLLYVGAIAVGGLLMWLARDFVHADANTRAGFALGFMLAGIGLVALLLGESRTVELDEYNRRIVLDIRRRRGGGVRLELPFSEIRELVIWRNGTRTDGSVYYDLLVRLLGGKEICLFGGCVFDGRMSRVWIEDLKARFERAIFSPAERSTTSRP